MTASFTPAPAPPAHPEPHTGTTASRLNWLRAGVLGANDGVVATSGLVIGVAASGAGSTALVTAGVAGLAAGALSMAVGEYVSVSAQRDSEGALLSRERAELAAFPEVELEELTGLYEVKGVPRALAQQVAAALTAHDALAAHAEAELKIDHEQLTNPWHAAAASMAAFVTGSVLPLMTILLISGTAGMQLTVVAAAVTLGLTGWISSRLGSSPLAPALARNVGGGLLAMAITFAIGSLVGAHIG